MNEWPKFETFQPGTMYVYSITFTSDEVDVLTNVLISGLHRCVLENAKPPEGAKTALKKLLGCKH